MRLSFAVLLLVYFAPGQLLSQILPKEASVHSYRLTGFSFPADKRATGYKIEIASGSYDNENDFKENIVSTVPGKTNRIITAVPSFGRQYTWRTVYEGPDFATYSELHHFSTSAVTYVDSAVTRLRVIKKTTQYKYAYFFVDGTRTLYDMEGHPVWYLPSVPGSVNAEATVRDLKLSCKGTITFMIDIDGPQDYEINYDGTVLWQGPNNGKVNGEKNENYHHEFTRLCNGHYMALGTQHGFWNRDPATSDNDNFLVFPGNGSGQTNPGRSYQPAPFATLIEYDQSGNVVWSWKSSTYFARSDLRYRPSAMGIENADVHDNAFFFDEKTSNIYVSFKNINRIVKVHYPDGKVLNSYGDKYAKDQPEKANGIFCKQHCAKLSEQGYLYVYNNNDCNPAAPPSIVMMQEPVSENDTLKKIWEFICPDELITTANNNSGMNFRSTGGGSVSELPDGSIFASMSANHGNIFIVNRDKKILWNAVPERWNADEKKWEMIGTYRASIITNPRDLLQLIWNVADVSGTK